MDKVARSAAAAVADVPHGATLLFGGFGVVQGWPNSLLLALRDHGARDLTVIFNTPGVGPLSAQLLAEAGLIRKVIASFAAYPTRPTPIEEQIKAGRIELELLPQGTLAERVRAGGAGIPAFYTPTGVGTLVAEGKERRTFGGREYVLETALTADYAVVRAQRADRHGNLVYRRGARNLHPVFATGGRLTLAEVDEVVAPGEIDPECVVTPGIYVDRVVRTEHPLDVEEIRALSRRYGRAVHMTPRPDLGGLPPDLMARRAALLLRDGEYVNLGLGLPTLVSNHIDAARDIVLHSENGMLGFGPLAEERDEDVDLYKLAANLIVDAARLGNDRIILCERGIKTFERTTRYTLDLGSVAVLKHETHLPVIVDPSHAAGRRDLVLPLARAAAAVGADGIIVETHPRPEEALCDGPQQIPTAEFGEFAREIAQIVELLGKQIG